MEYNLIKPINSEYTALEQVLTNRGIPIEEIGHYLHVTEEDNLSPLLLDNIKNAANILIKHIGMEGNTIKVQCDSDADGYTSAALLLNYIHARFPSAVNKFIYSLHSEKIHGIDMKSIPSNTTLVIAPDSSR